MKKILFILLLIMPAGFGKLKAQNKIIVLANDSAVSYVGRTLVGKEGDVSFDWSGTYFRTGLVGGELSLRISDTGINYYNVFVDDRLHKVVRTEGKDTLINFVSGIDRRLHSIRIQKRTEGERGKTTIHQFQLPIRGKLQKETDKPSRHIEFIGNSLTCGFGTEGKDRFEPFKAETENCNLTYAAIISRYFNADYTFIAHSGQGVVRNYGDSVRVSAYTMKDRMLNTFDLETVHRWNFQGGYRPDLVVVNLGSNDFSTDLHPLEDQFINAYKALIRQLRESYGDVLILCVSPGIAQRQITQYMERLCKELNDNRICLFIFPEGLYNVSTDLGSVWHPNFRGQAKMAMTLIPYISTISGWEFYESSIIR